MTNPGNKNVPARVFGIIFSLLTLGISLVWCFHKPGSSNTQLGASPLYLYQLDHYPKTFTASGLLLSLFLLSVSLFGPSSLVKKMFSTNEPGAKFTWFSRSLEYLGVVLFLLGALQAAIYNHMSLESKSLELIAAGAILVTLGFAVPRLPMN